MEERIGRSAGGYEVWPETIQTSVEIHSPVFIERFEYLLPEEHYGIILIH